jgi:carboxylesterase
MENQIMKGAEPLYIKNGNTGCLLLHGITASPAEMRELGEFLAGNGITVSIPLIAGHGTQPEDLIKVTWQDWYSSAEDSLKKIMQDCSKIFICGLSMGANLGILLSTKYKINGLITLAPAVKLKQLKVHLAPIFKYFTKYGPRGKHDIRDKSAIPKIISYQETPLESVHQLLKMSKVVRNKLNEVQCPILVMQAVKDHRVPISNVDLILNSVSSKIKEKVILTNSYHIIPLDYDKEIIKKSVLEFINKINLERFPEV